MTSFRHMPVVLKIVLVSQDDDDDDGNDATNEENTIAGSRGHDGPQDLRAITLPGLPELPSPKAQENLKVKAAGS